MATSHSWESKPGKGMGPKCSCQKCKVQDQIHGQDKVFTYRGHCKEIRGEGSLGGKSEWVARGVYKHFWLKR